MKVDNGTKTEGETQGRFSYRTVGLAITFVCSLLIVCPTSYSSSFLKKLAFSTSANNQERDEEVQDLFQFWDESYFSENSKEFDQVSPAAPHIQNCQRLDEETRKLEREPHWIEEDAPNPPWIEGRDDDNLLLTRRVQTDLWHHQHPKNCSDPSLRFLVANFEHNKGLGVGAQIVAMCGMFATALNEGRILILKEFNRAKHEDCKGSSYGRWSCYFASEASDECLARAIELEGDESAWSQGIITGVGNYSKNDKWIAVPDSRWGKPWEKMETLDVVNGQILGRHKAMDRQWWRAQALRYLIRFPSQYTCSLLNKVRHQTFGKVAAEMIIKSLPWPKANTEAEKLVWDNKPWVPRPLLSVHVRQGDKAGEMEIFNFSAHMLLAEQVRSRFPELQSIWLSTEMQTVVDEASYHQPRWKFFYTSVPRQTGTTRMSDYEERLGRKESSKNAIVNLLMAAECDFFVGALGSTWSYLLDGLRLTGGKLRSGFLSVNMDRYW